MSGCKHPGEGSCGQCFLCILSTFPQGLEEDFASLLSLSWGSFASAHESEALESLIWLCSCQGHMLTHSMSSAPYTFTLDFLHLCS